MSSSRRRPVVAVIGNAVATRRALAQARSVGRLVVERGWRLVTGGLGGVMRAASRGAHDATNYREGDVVGILPGSVAAAANEWVDICIATNLGYARNTLVVGMADVVIAVGGGAGTLTEMAMAWQLDKPLIGVEVDGWSRELAGRAIDDRPRAPVLAARDAKEAVELAAQTLGQRRRRGGRRE